MDHPFFVDGNGQNINIFARISQFSQDIGWYRGGSLYIPSINQQLEQSFPCEYEIRW
jgi:hypothetical protein